MAKRTWQQGRELSNQAYGVVKENRHLYQYTVRAAVAVVLTVVVAAAVALGVALALDDDLGAVVVLAVVAVAGLAAACIHARYQGAMVAAADPALRGEPSSYEQGMADSKPRTGALARWGLLNGTVGLVLSGLQGSGQGQGIAGVVAQIVALLIGAAWRALTFFVVPVLVFEDAKTFGAVKRSISILKEHWGTAAVGVVRVGVRVALVFSLPGLALLLGGGWLAFSAGDPATMALGGLVAAIGLALLIVGAVVNSTVRAVFGVALYRYATSGTALGPFRAEQLEGALQPRR